MLTLATFAGRWLPKVWSFLSSPLGILVIVALASYTYGHHKGYTSGTDKERAVWVAKYNADMDAIKKASAAASAAHATILKSDQARIAALEKEVTEYEAALEADPKERRCVGSPTDSKHFRRLLPP